LAGDKVVGKRRGVGLAMAASRLKRKAVAVLMVLFGIGSAKMILAVPAVVGRPAALRAHKVQRAHRGRKPSQIQIQGTAPLLMMCSNVSSRTLPLAKQARDEGFDRLSHLDDALGLSRSLRPRGLLVAGFF